MKVNATNGILVLEGKTQRDTSKSMFQKKDVMGENEMKYMGKQTWQIRHDVTIRFFEVVKYQQGKRISIKILKPQTTYLKRPNQDLILKIWFMNMFQEP